MKVDQQKYRHRAFPANQLGLSLVELLISIGLGIFLTWGATQAFLSGKQTYSMQQAVSRIQENGRLAQEFLGFDIRDAGSYGCASSKFVSNYNNPVATAKIFAVGFPGTVEYQFQNSVFAVNNVSGAPTGDMALQTPLNPPPVAGTDILVVRTSSNLGLEVLSTVPPIVIPTPAPIPTPKKADFANTTQITVNNMGLKAGDVLAVSDCTSTKIFIPTNVNPAGATATINYNFNQPVMPGSSVMRLDTAIYYIANNASGNPSLYRRLLDDGATSQELLDGVQDMQLEFGVGPANQVTAYVAPNAVLAGQWDSWNDTDNDQSITAGTESRVRTVRYSLLLRSQENLLEAPQTYNYNGAAVVAPDNRLRQVSTGTVSIRSRLN